MTLADDVGVTDDRMPRAEAQVEIAGRVQTAVRPALAGAVVALGWMAIAFLLGPTSPAAHAATTPAIPPPHSASALVGSLASTVDDVTIETMPPSAVRAVSAAAAPVADATAQLPHGVVAPATNAVARTSSAVTFAVAHIPVIGGAAHALNVTQAVTTISGTLDRTISSVADAAATGTARVLVTATAGTQTAGSTTAPGTTTVSAPGSGTTATPSPLADAVALTPAWHPPEAGTRRADATQGMWTPGLSEVVETTALDTTAPMVGATAAASAAPAAPGGPAAPTGDCTAATGLCLPGTSGTGLVAAATLAAGLILTRRLWSTSPGNAASRIAPAIALAPDVRPG